MLIQAAVSILLFVSPMLFLFFSFLFFFFFLLNQIKCSKYIAFVLLIPNILQVSASNVDTSYLISKSAFSITLINTSADKVSNSCRMFSFRASNTQRPILIIHARSVCV
uniref:Uncharacterized protein n=1 Tax=Cacopsylla melanoneura TaxID=428564 RepID=A0A8D8QY59_9HEMI